MNELDDAISRIPEHLRSYYEEFRKQLDAIDAIALVVIKAHLVLETVLNSILDRIFFNPDYLDRFGFYQKVLIARAQALRSDDLGMWDLVLALNKLRNEIAHSLDSNKRDLAFKNVRNVYFSEFGKEFNAQRKEDYDDVALVRHAYASCIGFLGSFEHDLKALRGIIDSADAALQDKSKIG